MSTKVARKYGNALFQVATEENRTDETYRELRLLHHAFQNRELLSTLNHPEIEDYDKKALIDKLFKDDLSARMMNFLYVLIDQNRFSSMPDIARYYGELWFKARKIERITVISAVELSPERLKAIGRAYVGDRDVTLKMDNKVDPSILGGIILEVGGAHIDRSVRGELNNLKMRLTNATHL